MKRNNFFSRFIVVTLTAALLLVSGSRAIPASALAVGPLADPVYDTEIIAFKDYVEQNLSAPQLDILFFLVGGLAVAQMGAQDAMLISPYPNEESVKEWIINCGIQLYNSVIGLVPEGDYYMGIPSIGTAGQKGVPRQVIKGLVAQMMGDAVVAINYPDLDTFLEENPNEIYMPFNPDLQLGVNAIFGLNGGIYDWQFTERAWLDVTVSWDAPTMTGANRQTYDAAVAALAHPHPIYRYVYTYYPWESAIADVDLSRYDIFINTAQNKIGFVTNAGNYDISLGNIPFIYWNPSTNRVVNATKNFTAWSVTYDPTLYTSYKDIVNDYLNTPHHGQDSSNISIWPTMGKINNSYWNYGYLFPADMFSGNVYVGPSWASKELINNVTDLNLRVDQTQYFQQVTNDYLFDLRGLMGDLVNYVYLNPIWDNLYDLVGNLVLPDRVKVSVDLTPITDLLAPPVPVNLNDIAELTDNTYLERVKEHARNAGDIFANYVAFWHNCDSDLVYTVFGAAILVLVGAFVGKWGHS